MSAKNKLNYKEHYDRFVEKRLTDYAFFYWLIPKLWALHQSYRSKRFLWAVLSKLKNG